jgi:hypothetical protein
MFFLPGLRPQIIASLISLGVIIAAYFLRKAFGPTQRDPEQVVREAEAAPSPESE